MPSNIDKTRVGKVNDRRIKLTDAQKSEIRENKSSLSQRQLAAFYGVSRRSIQFILNPDSHARNIQVRLDRGGWKQYYNKEQHTKNMREHRRYKRSLIESTTGEQ